MVSTQIENRGLLHALTLEALRSVPRHHFVPSIHQKRAYEDRALPIQKDQTISQPYMVGLMTSALELTGKERVLEIGTGSGYQTAILSRCAQEVFTIERHASLAQKARQELDSLLCENIRFRVGDGTLGWPEEAPFDRILVTAGAPEVPTALLDQIVESGALVVPVGGKREQQLLRIRSTPEGHSRETLCHCTFVPLLGQQGWSA